MLYINNDPVPVSIDELEKGSIDKYAKDTTYKMPAHAVYYCKENQKIMGRNSQPIIMQYPFTIRDKVGKIIKTVQLRYADSAMPHTANPELTVFSPEFMTIGGNRIMKVPAEKPELNFFLQNHVNNGTNPNRPKMGYEIYFDVADRQANARKHLMAAVNEANASAMVLGNYQLSDDELKKVAYVYWHADATLYQFHESPEVMSSDELRFQMLILAKGDPAKFMKFLGTVQSFGRELVNKCISKKIIELDEVNHQWLMKNEAGVPQVILKLKEKEEAGASLIDFLENKDKKGLAQDMQQRLNILSAAVI